MHDDADNIGFQVIGELKSDPGHLLLLGDDDDWYDYEITTGNVTQIELSDSWSVDVACPVMLRVETPKRMMVS